MYEIVYVLCTFKYLPLLKNYFICFSSTILQAFLEHGIPESPEIIVALMQKVWNIQDPRAPVYNCKYNFSQIPFICIKQVIKNTSAGQ